MINFKIFLKLGAPGWLSQLSFCLWLLSRAHGHGIEPHMGLPPSPFSSVPPPVHVLFPFSLSLALCILSLSQINKYKSFFLKLWFNLNFFPKLTALNLMPFIKWSTFPSDLKYITHLITIYTSFVSFLFDLSDWLVY